MRLSYALLSLWAMPVQLLAQTGPAGVGTAASNFLWLDANYHVTVASNAVVQWSDRSGNGNHAGQTVAAQRPLLAGSIMNGYPSILFDNDQTNYDFLRVPDNSTLEGMTGLTGFVVYQLLPGTASSAPRCFFSKRDGVDIQEAYDWFLWGGSGSSPITQQLDIVNTNNRASSSTSYTTGTTYLNAFTYHGDTPSNSNDQILYDGNTVVGNGVESATSIPNYTSDLYVGILRGHTGTGGNVSRFNGYISEIILYNTVLNDAQRIIVNNYLAAKYGTALATGDVYRQDDPVQGNYDHDMAGIGRTNASNIQSDSRSGVLRIHNPTNLDNDEFLLWGHDAGYLGTFAVYDLPTGVEGRWQRTWRVSEVNTSYTAVDVGAVDITFDLSGFGSVTANDLRLLVDTDNNGVFANDTPITGATSLGSGLYRFSGVTALSNNLRFTLGTANATSTPLPVQLVDFTGELAGLGAHLTWRTATEQNSDHFMVQRSTDLTSWLPFARVSAAGESSTLRTYETFDTQPLVSTTYYRIEQVDGDGTVEYSPVISLDPRTQSGPQLWPNPTQGSLHIASTSAELLSCTLTDMQGRILLAYTGILGPEAQLDLRPYGTGTYLLMVETTFGTTQHRVIVEH